jgi:murein DD-endopeptidase MepM/ murein hydrolase activator NlpD
MKLESVVRGMAAGAALVSMTVFGGCATSRMIDTGERGLFQRAEPSPTVSFQTHSSENQISSAVGKKSESGFVWPVSEGSISSFFGKRKRDFHDGIDIRVNYGSPIFAAKNGEIIYSSHKIKGYGNMIVIKHDDGMATVYAHNRKNLVKRGDHVTQGQIVGFVGATGKATGPHLHFEVRKGELPQDPLLYLPEMRARNVAQQ